MKLIVRIDRHTAKLCLSLVDLCGREIYPWRRDDCGKLHLAAYLLIERAGCPPCPPTPCKQLCLPFCDKPCDEPEPEPVLSGLRYDAFDSDVVGRTCFFLDDQLLRDKPGRYDARLFVCDEEVSKFQLELNRKVRIRDIHRQQSKEAAYC